nr:MAG TPA: hypothetical protein [Caudoviricetes sp.]
MIKNNLVSRNYVTILTVSMLKKMCRYDKMKREVDKERGCVG